MKKITKATFKSFIKKNKDNLYIMNLSNFDGMIDSIQSYENPQFRKAQFNINPKIDNHTLGISSVWLVNGSGDYFKSFKNEKFEGIEVSNCCGHFVVAIPNEKINL